MFGTQIANRTARGMAVGALLLAFAATTFAGSAYAAPLAENDCSAAAHARNDAAHLLHTAWKAFEGDLKDLARDARQLQHESHKTGDVVINDARDLVKDAKGELKDIRSQAHEDIQAAVELGAACKDEDEDATSSTDTTTTTTSTDTTSSTTTDTTPSPSLVFDDEFGGTADARPDPSKWYVFGNVCPRSTNWAYSCLKQSNAFQDGNGHLVLRVTGGTQGRPYDGAEISPSPLNGYPSTNVKYKFPPGSRLEIRAKFAPGVGLWETLWSVAPDSVTQDVLELDMQEWRGNHPNLDDCHTHYSVEYGSEPNTGEDLSADWHTYWMDYYRDHVVFGMDNMTCGKTPLIVAPAETPILWNMVAPPTTGAGAGGPPLASDIPADMLVDYVRVYALS